MGKKVGIFRTGISGLAVLGILTTVILMIMNASGVDIVIEKDSTIDDNEHVYKKRQGWFWTAMAILIPLTLMLLFFGRTYTTHTDTGSTTGIHKGVAGGMVTTLFLFVLMLILTLTKVVGVDPGLGSIILFLYLFLVFATWRVSSTGTILGRVGEALSGKAGLVRQEVAQREAAIAQQKAALSALESTSPRYVSPPVQQYTPPPASYTPPPYIPPSYAPPPVTQQIPQA